MNNNERVTSESQSATVQKSGKIRYLVGKFYAAFYFLRTGGKVRGKSYILRQPSLIRATDSGIINLGIGVTIEKGARIVAKKKLDIGPGTYIGKNSTLVAFETLTIGKNVLLAENVSVHTEDHGPAGDRDNFRVAPITLHDDVWIGAGTVITKGVEVGPRTTVGANAVVTKTLPSDSIAVGVPARVKTPETVQP